MNKGQLLKRACGFSGRLPTTSHNMRNETIDKRNKWQTKLVCQREEGYVDQMRHCKRPHELRACTTFTRGSGWSGSVFTYWNDYFEMTIASVAHNSLRLKPVPCDQTPFLMTSHCRLQTRQKMKRFLENVRRFGFLTTLSSCIAFFLFV